MHPPASTRDTRDMFHEVAYHSGFAVVLDTASHKAVPLTNHLLHAGIALTVPVQWLVALECH